MLGVFAGMRVRLTKKICEPELVQEATGEIVDLAFHPEERFGNPASSNIRPSDNHDCWKQGWVKCDRCRHNILTDQWQYELWKYVGMFASSCSSGG